MKINFIILLLLIVSCKNSEKQAPETDVSAELKPTLTWFSAWELVAEDIYHLKEYESVEFVFFDDKSVYSTSSITIPTGMEIEGPSIFGEDLNWKQKEHNGKITLPSGETAPLGLMVFAAPLKNKKQEAFFIMPLPSFWKDAGVKSDLPYEHFLTGIFLHEFSHTQQMNGIGARITELSETVNFEPELSDEIVQEIFSKDSTYVGYYELEHSKIFEAIKANETEKRLKLTEGILSLMKTREEKYFTEDYSSLKELNQLFLTMEGVGQYTMYEWLMHPRGGNIDEESAFNGTRTKSWIQDEGFGFTILLSKFSEPEIWGNKVFGKNSETLTELMEDAIKSL